MGGCVPKRGVRRSCGHRPVKARMKERCRHYPDPYQSSSLIDQRCPRKAFSLVRRSELRQLRHQETGAAIVQLEHAVRRIRRPSVQALLPSAAGRAGIIEAGRQRLRGQRGLRRIQRKAGARAVLRWKSRRTQARRPAAPGTCTRSARSRAKKRQHRLPSMIRQRQHQCSSPPGSPPWTKWSIPWHWPAR